MIVRDFEVEQVVYYKVNQRGKSEYLLKWKVFPSNDNTWECGSNLNCHDLIEAYWASKVGRNKEEPSKKSNARTGSRKQTESERQQASTRSVHPNQMVNDEMATMEVIETTENVDEAANMTPVL